MPRLQTGRRSPLFYAGLIALQCLLWGVGNPLMKIGISRMPPLLLLTLRYLAATALFALFFGRRCLKGLRRVSPGLLAAVCGFTAMSFICANLGLLHTSATNASFLMGMAVLFAPFFAPLFLGTRFHAGDLVPVAVTVAGLYLMCGMSGVPHFGLGEWLGLLSACFGAASMVLTPKLLVEMDGFTANDGGHPVGHDRAVLPCRLAADGGASPPGGGAGGELAGDCLLGDCLHLYRLSAAKHGAALAGAVLCGAAHVFRARLLGGGRLFDAA